MTSFDKRIPKHTITSEEYNTMLNWSDKEALAAQHAEDEKNSNDPNNANVLARGALCKWSSIQKIEKCRKKYLEGDNSQVPEAIFHCTMDDLPLPEWCADAFRSLYRKIHPWKGKSWDEAFGRPYPKGTNLNAKQRRRQVGLQVYNYISKRLQMVPRPPIDEALFEEAGEQFGIKKTLASEYYAYWKKFFPEIKD